MNNTIKESLDFIGLYELEDKTIAPGIVEFYENNPNLHHDAGSGAGKNNEIVNIGYYISSYTGLFLNIIINSINTDNKNPA